MCTGIVWLGVGFGGEGFWTRVYGRVGNFCTEVGDCEFLKRPLVTVVQHRTGHEGPKGE